MWLARVRASHYHIRKIWMFDRMFEQFDSPRAQALARQRKRARGLHTCTLGSPNICVYKIPLNKIHYKIHFNNSPSCIFCFYIVHLSKLVPRLHCLHAAVFVTCDVLIHRTSQRRPHVNKNVFYNVFYSAEFYKHRYLGYLGLHLFTISSRNIILLSITVKRRTVSSRNIAF